MKTVTDLRIFKETKMGMPGHIKVKIETKFDAENNSASRTITVLGGVGLNSLVPSLMGDPECWDVNCEIMRDTIDLPDGEYKLKVKATSDGWGQTGYRWEVTQ